MTASRKGIITGGGMNRLYPSTKVPNSLYQSMTSQ